MEVVVEPLGNIQLTVRNLAWRHRLCRRFALRIGLLTASTEKK